MAVERPKNNTRIGFIGAGLGVIGIAVAIIQPFEGREHEAYKDPIGIWTICDGATLGVIPGDIADDAECDKMTARDAAIAEATLERCSPRLIMPAYRRAAFISFIFNVGPGRKGGKDGYCIIGKTGNKSTMRRLLEAGDQIGACNQLPQWNKAGGKVFRGLVERRKAERLVCIGLIVDGAGNWHDWRPR